ncbi:MAG TPA: hypothetical protein EYN73_02605 [Chromatiaceae bacterium]|nr:hypothetical protein [Chromatiaceae bacterium]
MLDQSYIQGVITGITARLSKNGVELHAIDQYSVHLGDEMDVLIIAPPQVVDSLDDASHSLCELVAVGKACVHLAAAETPEYTALEYTALFEAFARTEQICLRGKKADAVHRAHKPNLDARAKSRQLAEWHWYRRKCGNMTAISRLIAHELAMLGLMNRDGKTFQPATIRRWIRPLAPSDQMSGYPVG